MIDIYRRECESVVIKALSQLSLPKNMCQRTCIELAHHTGFKGYEPVFKLGSNADHQEINEIKRISNSYNITLTSVATELHWRYSLSSLDNKIRQKAVDIGKAQIDYCKYLNTSISLLVPGHYMADMDYTDSFERLRDSIYQLLEYTKPLNVVLGIENVINGFFTSAMELQEFVDSFHSDFIGVYFDIGNAGYYNYPHLWARTLGSRIKSVHIKDYNTKVGNINGFCALLTGNIEFVKVLQVLSDNGYTGSVTGEVPCNDGYPDLLPRFTSMAMDEIFAKLQ